jgi:sulfonate transport system substrate-binding protein
MTMPHRTTTTTPPLRTARATGPRRSGRAAGLLGAVAVAVTAVTSGVAGVTPATAGAASPNLSGVTINVADQFKQYETVFAATDALKGAPYKVSWSQFIGGPPIIAAETGGSVDLGDMAETPTIFAQAAGDPVKVVAALKGTVSTASPYAILVPKGSPITKVSQLRGHSLALQVGTIAQYLAVQILKKANVPYSSVNIDDLSFVNGSTAVTAGQVDAAIVPQPLAAEDLAGGKVTQLVSGAGYIENLGYLTASQAALANKQKAAAIADFIKRFYKAQATLAKNPKLAAATYSATFGIPESEALTAVKSVQMEGTPITPAIIKYQQTEANTFQQLGLISQKINVATVFDLPFNKVVAQQSGLTS